MWPATVLYGATSLLRRALYDAGILPVHGAPPGCKVVSVGALEAGGSGKTPTAAHVLRLLLRWGLCPGLLTRGYGRQSRGLVIRRRGVWVPPDTLGDEPAMLVQQGFDVAVAACGRRLLGARALSQLGCDTLVLDDGFTHRALARDLDIVVLRGEAPLADGRFLPWGNLRELPSSLARADILWLNYRRGVPPTTPPAALRQRFADKLIVMAQVVPSKPRNQAGEQQVLHRVPIVAAAGIARPEDFLAHLQAAGADVRDFLIFRDHHAFDKKQVDALVRRVRACGAQALVVTAKDAVKLVSLQYPETLWCCDTHLVLYWGQNEFEKRLKSVVRTVT